MIRDVTFRVIVQGKTDAKNITNIYYPVLIAAQTCDEIGKASTATIEIVGNVDLGTYIYIPAILEDDLIRLQVCERNFPTDKVSWVEIFSGKIVEMKSTYGTKNTISLFCSGHLEEADWTTIEEDYTASSNVDATTLLNHFLTKYHRNMEYSSKYCDEGIIVPAYSSTANQTHMCDLYAELEKISGNLWYIDAIPIYDTDENLENVYLSWQAFPTKPTDKYRIIEGSGRYISSNWTSSIENLATNVIVKGDNPPDTTTTAGNPVTKNAKYSYSYFNETTQATYGRRTVVETYSWIKSSSQCQAIAQGTITDLGTPIISGSVILIGTPYARKGDLVTCYLPSSKVNGAIIDDDYIIYRVQHNISGTTFTTTVDPGRTEKTAYNYIGKICETVKTVKKNQCSN